MELEKKYEEIRGRIKRIPLEIDSTKEKIEKARADLAGIEERVIAAREKRQGLLARGESAAAITSEIKKVREEQELNEDLISGLLGVIDSLEIEMKKHAEDLPNLARQVFWSKIGELIPRYNKAAREMARVLEDLSFLGMDYGQPTLVGEFGPFAALPHRLPLLTDKGVAGAGEDLFNYRSLSEMLRNELSARIEKRTAQGEVDIDVVDIVREIREGRAGLKKDK